jgi:hypothetical protein
MVEIPSMNAGGHEADPALPQCQAPQGRMIRDMDTKEPIRWKNLWPTLSELTSRQSIKLPESSWPGDFSMQNWCMEQQNAALDEIMETSSP